MIALTITPSKFTPEQLKLARHAREVFWSSSWRKALPREDQRIEYLENYTATLCNGDRALGGELAMEAIWA